MMTSHSQSKTDSSKVLQFVAQMVTRTLVIHFTVGAILVLVNSRDNAFIFGQKFTADYSYASAMRFLFVADILVCALSILSLAYVCFLHLSGSTNPANNFLLFLHDMVMTFSCLASILFLPVTAMVMLSGCVAASAVGYVAHYGETKMAWQPVCNMVPKFCHKTVVSVTMSYLAFFSYLALATVNAYKLTSPN